MAQAYGWRVALALAAAPGAAARAGAAAVARAGAAQKSGAANDAGRRCSRIPALWWIALSGAMLNFVLYSFSYFVSAFLTRFHGLSVAQAGIWSGIGSGAAGMPGRWRWWRSAGGLRFAARRGAAGGAAGVIAIRLPRGECMRQSRS